MFFMYKWLNENYPQDKIFDRREIEMAFFDKMNEVNETLGKQIYHPSYSHTSITPIKGVGCGCFSWQESEDTPVTHQYIYFYEKED